MRRRRDVTSEGRQYSAALIGLRPTQALGNLISETCLERHDQAHTNCGYGRAGRISSTEQPISKRGPLPNHNEPTIVFVGSLLASVGFLFSHHHTLLFASYLAVIAHLLWDSGLISVVIVHVGWD